MRFFLLLAVVQLGAVSPASANLPVFEAYAGQRPKKPEPALVSFLAEMERLSPGFFASPKRIQAAFGSRLPLPGSDPTLTAVDFTKKLELADAIWIRQPALEKLLPALASAVELGKANPAHLVSDAGRREIFRRVLLAYALALKRGGDVQRSQDAMAEWIRTFPDQVITRAHAGSDAEQLYVETRQVLSTRGRGTLTVGLGDPSLQLYVDEVSHRAGAPVVDLLPGTYRVLVVDRYNNARRYSVDVLVNQDAVLKIDWTVDSVLQIAPTFVALEFPSAAELAQAGQAVARFAQAAIGAPGALLIKPSKADRGQLTLTAETYAPGHVAFVNSASVLITGNARTDAERAAALAHYLVNHSSQPDVIVHAQPVEAVAPLVKAPTTGLDARTMAAAVQPPPARPAVARAAPPAAEPVTPAPVTPAPIKPGPVTPAPSKPAPATPAPATPPPTKPASSGAAPDVPVKPASSAPAPEMLMPVPVEATGEASSSTATTRSGLLFPELALGGGLILGGSSLYVASTTSSDTLKRGSYVVAIGSLVSLAVGLTGIILYFVDDSPVASVQRNKTLIGLAPLDRGGAITVVGRF